MKFLMAFALLCTAQLASAQSNNNVEIIDAINESLASHKLTCVQSTEKEPYDATRLNLKYMLGGEIKVNEEGRPEITMFKKEGSMRSTVEVFLTEDLMTVTKIVINQTTVSIERRNVGTITRPRYENIETSTKVYDLICE